MGFSDKLRSLREELYPLQHRRTQVRSSPPLQLSPSSQPAPAPPPSASFTASVLPSPPRGQSSISSTSTASFPESRSVPRTPSQCSPLQPRATPASSLFPVMGLVENPGASKKSIRPHPVYVSLSSDLRLIHAISAARAPSCILEFRQADFCLELKRISHERPPGSLAVDALVSQRVELVTHPEGHAVRIVDKRRTFLLIAASEDERDAFLSALRLRLLPWHVLRERMKSEMSEAHTYISSSSAPSLVDAVRGFGSDPSGAADGSPDPSCEVVDKGAERTAKWVWEKAESVAEVSIWSATIGQGLGGVVRTADELEKLTKPLGGLAVVGCAFSLVALSARAVSLMALEREGRESLSMARDDLREASVSLVSWLFAILGSGFRDEDGLVGKVFDALRDCWDAADELEQYLMRNWALRAWKVEEISTIIAKVDCVKGRLLGAGLLSVVAKHERQIDENSRRIGTMESQNLCGDEFSPYAPDPFSFNDGLVVSAATSLTQLKSAVLPVGSAHKSADEGHSAGSDSSSNSRRVTLTSVNGEGGVGKTSTCKLLCADAEVLKYFAEGAILWIDVGQGATEVDMKVEVAGALSLCGGERSAELVRSSSGFKAAVAIARKFFSKRRIFIVVDNVWETPAGSSVDNWAEPLSKMACCPGSAVLMTTRLSSLSLSPGFNRVKLSRLDLVTRDSPDWHIAEGLYDALLRAAPACVTLDKQSSVGYKRDRRKALELSCGVILAITTFAGLVRSRLEIGDNVESILSYIELKSLGLSDRIVGEDLKCAVGHPGLFAAMEESLSYLDEREAKLRRVKSEPLSVREDGDGNDVRLFRSSYDAFPGKSLSARYAALEMMPRSSTSLSFPLLCRVWHVPTVADVKSIALLFVNIGLGRIEGGEEKAFVLHDLQYAFCARFGSMSTAVEIVGGRTSAVATVNGHALFLASCESLFSSDNVPEDFGSGWVRLCFDEGFGLSATRLSEVLRPFLGQNLFRHLCAAAAAADTGRVRRTILSVLADFRWLRGRIARYGRASAVWDFCCVSAYFSTVSSAGAVLPDIHTGISIRAVCACLMLLADDVSMEADGTLAGALIQIFQSFIDNGGDGLDIAFINKLASSVADEVRGPWLKAIGGCSRVRDQSALAHAYVGEGKWVLALTALGDGAHVVSMSSDGVVRVHENTYLETVLALDGNNVGVNCVGVAMKEGPGGMFYIYSGKDDGTVCFWEVRLDPVEGLAENASHSLSTSAVVGDCGSCVWCLSVSTGGGVVAAGCADGRIFIWKRQNEEIVPFYELVTGFNCSASPRLARICGVAVSRSGDFVVGGSMEGDLAFWSSMGSGSEGAVERRSASNDRDNRLCYVLLSEDESKLVVLISRPVRCEVWDVASRSKLSSRDVLVAGGWDKRSGGLIAVYTIGDGCKQSSTYRLVSTPRSVCCTSLDADKRIFIGAEDGCVRILAAGTSAASGSTGLYEGGLCVLPTVETGSGASLVPGLVAVSTVAVMPTAGLVVAGHENGCFSLWRAETGEFVRVFEDERGPWVNCIDISGDECMAATGHENGVALVWDSSTWKCRFALERHSEQVRCTTISADKSHIVTVDWRGELRVWDADMGGTALLVIKTKLHFSVVASKGAVSLDGKTFLWASKGESRRFPTWDARLIDIRSGGMLFCSESDHSDWDDLLEEMTLGAGSIGEVDARWRFGAVCGNLVVKLSVGAVESADLWRISSGGGRGVFCPRVNCTFWSANEETCGEASLVFDSTVHSIAADWIPYQYKADAHRRALVACMLDGRANPAILHFYPSNLS